MELSGELDLGLDLGVVVGKGHLGELYAQLVLTSVFSLVLVLHVRVHVAIEQLLVILVSQLEANTLVWSAAPLDHEVIGLNK